VTIVTRAGRRAPDCSSSGCLHVPACPSIMVPRSPMGQRGRKRSSSAWSRRCRVITRLEVGSSRCRRAAVPHRPRSHTVHLDRAVFRARRTDATVAASGGSGA
jgi:hypothetical protein